MDIFNQKVISNFRLLGNLVVELTYTDGSQGTYSNVLWSVNADGDGEGSIHLSQGGAVGGIGFFGYRVSPDTPLNIDGNEITDISVLEDYMIASLTAGGAPVIPPPAPVMSTTGSLSALTSTYGTASASTNFSVSGFNMQAGILVNPPSSFEVSLNNTTFTNTVTVGSTGTIAPTTVYLRLKASDAPSNYSGNIVLSSTGVTSINVATISSTMNKATLTVTAVNKTKVYGAALPALTLTYSGYVLGQSASDLITAPTLSTTGLVSSAFGSYPITASGGISNNYNFTYVAGSLSVTKANLTFTAANASRAYGAANPTFTVTPSGYVNGDTVAVVTTNATATSVANGTSAPSTYSIVPSGAVVNTNYTPVYVNGTLTVTALAISTLSNLVISGATLAPGFAAGTLAYTSTVANAVASVTVTPTTTSNVATVKVNTVTVVSGQASGAIALVEGDNVITVVGTAQNGSTTSTYTVTITRSAP